MTRHRTARARPGSGSRLLIGTAFVALVAAGCGGSSSAPPLVAGQDFTVVVDLDPLRDLVEQVAGGRAEVVALVPSGLDGHTYEPRPSDVETLATAHAFIGNGGQLNPAIEQLAEDNLPEDSALIKLANVTIRDDEVLYTDLHSHGDGVEHGHTANAHLWTNPPYTMRYVDEIAAALTELDPDGAVIYADNADRLNARLETLSDAIAEAVVTVPPEMRKLVVYHDSWSYFGRNYGIEVIGAIQPADFSEPSAAEVGAMIEQIRAESVPAFFGSEVFPSDVLGTVARESGADHVADLNDDRLPGEPGDPEHGYVGMMVHNVRTIVDALGGDSTPLDAVELGAIS